MIDSQEDSDMEVVAVEEEVEEATILGIEGEEGMLIEEGTVIHLEQGMPSTDREQTAGILGVEDWYSHESMRVLRMVRDILWTGTTEEYIIMQEGEERAIPTTTTIIAATVPMGATRFHS